MQFYHLFGCLYVLTYHYSSANVSHVLQSFFFNMLHPPFHPCMKGSGSNWKTWHPKESYSLSPNLAQIQSSVNLASYAKLSLHIQSVMLKHLIYGAKHHHA